MKTRPLFAKAALAAAIALGSASASANIPTA